MDMLRSGIGLRGYGQKDPKIEYKKEGYEIFEDMLNAIKEEVTDLVFKVHIAREEAEEIRDSRYSEGNAVHEDFQGGEGPEGQTNLGENEPLEPQRREQEKVSRNSPCPCGSGKKYKSCCMRKKKAS